MSDETHGFLSCPFCATPVKLVTTEEAFRHAGSAAWTTTVFTKCKCFQERWQWSDYGEKGDILAKAKTVWNCRKQ